MNPFAWVGYPKSYTPGRSRAVQFITLHYTAGSEGPISAETGAAYDKTRTDGTSCHAFIDSVGLACQEVPFGDRAHTAFFHGNEIGVHFEICGTRQTREQWLDGTSYATLVTTAAAVVYTGQLLAIPMQRLSVEQTRAAYYAPAAQRPKGINDHGTVTLAFPEDGGDHTDVGPEFPWDVLFSLIAGGAPPLPPPPPSIGVMDMLFAVKELSHPDVFLSNGLRRRLAPSWTQVQNMNSAGFLLQPKISTDPNSSFLFLVPDGQLDAYAGPLDIDVIDGDDIDELMPHHHATSGGQTGPAVED